MCFHKAVGAAEVFQRVPRLNERCSQSSPTLILLLPALPLDTGEDLFSSPPIMPCLVFQARKNVCVCVCVCGKSRVRAHKHIDSTVTDTQSFKYTHSPEHKDTHTEKGTKKAHRAETVRLLHQNRETPPPATPAAELNYIQMRKMCVCVCVCV